MKISEFMMSLLERLAEMFPESNYQRRLEAYLSDKHITDTFQLEHYIREFDRNMRG